ncbi:MAG: RodZ domain-containing protein [Pseudomonadota bacterium]
MTGRRFEQSSDSPQRPVGFDDYELKLGDIMRGERATLGKSLLDVQRDIKIKASYLAAIEEADLDAFETPGFIAGYIRAYSRYLGLNPDWAYRTFCKESGFTHVEGLQAQIHSNKPKPENKTRRPARSSHDGDDLFARSPIYAAPKESPWAGIRPGMVGSFAVLIALICGLGYGGWSVLREIQKVDIAPVETALGATPPEAADTQGPMQDAAAEVPRSDIMDRLYRPRALEVPVLVARDGPISALDPRQEGVYASSPSPSGLAPTLADDPRVPGTVFADAAVASETLGADGGEGSVIALNEVQVTAPPPPEVVIFAREPVWVRVRSADGTVLHEKILDGGERYVLPQTEEPPTLRAGNSSSLFFAVNGETLGPAGQGASVVKNISLGAGDLVAAYQPVDLDQDPELAQLAALMIAPVETEE